MAIPLWAFGLVLAGAAPFVVGFLTDALRARAKKRTERFIDVDGSAAGGTSQARAPVDRNA